MEDREDGSSGCIHGLSAADQSLNRRGTADQDVDRNRRQVAAAGMQQEEIPHELEWRIMELEMEKLRLQELVATLLMKNQQLRADKGASRERLHPAMLNL